MIYRNFLTEIKEDNRLVLLNEGKNSFVVRPKNGSRRNIRLPKKFTNDMAFLSGIIIGDGHMENKPGRYRIFIQMTDKNILEISREKFWRDFLIPLKVRKVKKREGRMQTYKISFQNKVLWTLFTKVFEIPSGRKSAIVKVPEIVMKNKDLQKDFISGLFLADGGYNNKSIIFCSVSKDLSRNVMKMLGTMGIRSTTNKLFNKRFNRTFYESYIRGEHKEKFKLLFPQTAIKFAGVA